MTIPQRSLGLLMAASAIVSVGLWLHEHPPFEAALTKPRVSHEGSGATVVQPQKASVNSAEAKVRLQKMGRMPLYFIENRGQLDSRVAYYVQGRDTTLYFTAEGMTLAQSEQRHGEKVDRGRLEKTSLGQGIPQAPDPGSRWVVKLDFVGANPAVKMAGEGKTAAVISYFMGPREQWKAGLPTYSRVVYSDLWPGIDLVYSGTADRLKYSFLVKPGADPERIRLAYRGATVRQNGKGQLEVETPVGGFSDDTPYSYQEVDGQRAEIGTAYALEPTTPGEIQAYGFNVGPYDRSKPLVIDPAMLVYAGYIGGSDNDQGRGIAVDASGSAFVTGYTDSTEAFPVTVGPDLTQNGNADAFVAKVNSSGTALDYAGFIGGIGTDQGFGIAVDGSGNAYVFGRTDSTQATFPVALGPDLTYNGGPADAFVAKVNAAGTALIYCGYIGGSSVDIGNGIAVDGLGSAYVTGQTSSAEATFPETVGPDLAYNGGVTDAFVAKVNSSGMALDYAGYIGGIEGDEGRGIAVDGLGNAYVTGSTGSSEATFPETVGPDLTYNVFTDAFVAKVNSSGMALDYAGYIGGSFPDIGFGIAVDGSGNAYVTGRTESTEATFPETVGPDLTFNGAVDAFVAKVNSSGMALDYVGYIGGNGSDVGNGIAVDGLGNTYVTGDTNSAEATFPVTGGPDATYNGLDDAFVAKINSAGTALTYAGYIGGLERDSGLGIAVDASSSAYVTGYTESAENRAFPVTVGPALTMNTRPDAFVAKISEMAPATPTPTATPTETATATPTPTSTPPPAGTTAYLSSSSNPTTFGQPVTFFSSVSAVFGTPTGAVTFKDGATTIATVSLDGSARAQYTTALLSAGTHAITAVYSGDSTHEASTSGVVNQVVNPATAACGNLGTAVNYAAGVGAFAVAVGDFDNDGKPDVVVTNRSDNDLSVLLGNGDGTLQARVDYATGSAPYFVMVGDFNNDGKSDLTVANASGGTVSVLLGNGDGTFQAKVDYGVGSGTSSVALGDFDNDGNPDLAATNSGSGTVSVLLGNGDGTFQAKVDYSAGSAPYSVAVGDFNADGKPDLAVANLNGANLSVLLGNGDGTFQAAVNYGVGSFPASVAVGDFNNDGSPDLAVANSGSSSNNVSVLLGSGNGTFQAAVNYGTGAIPASVAIGDFNNDGSPDLATANQSGNTVSILRGNGNGTFQTKVDYAAGGAPPSVAVGDFNGDGRPDVVVANFNDNNLSILLNVVPTAVASGSATISAGQSTPLSGSGGVSCSWSPAAGLSDANSCSPTASPSVTTTYTLVVTDVNGCPSTNNPTVTVTVLSATTTFLSSSANPTTLGQPVTFSSSVSSVSGTPTGSVTFKDGATTFATVSLDGSARAQYTTTSLSAATHAITAVYSGDATHEVSTSGVVNQVVNPATAACGSLGTAVNYAAGTGAFSVAVGDFNNDGKPDVVVTNRSDNDLSVLLGNGDGTLQARVDYAAGSAPYSVAVGDFNNDGNPDLAVANSSGANLSVLLGNGDGTFQSKVDYGIGSGPSWVAVGDFNNDGSADLAATNSGSNTVSVLLGNGDGTLQAKVDYAAGTAPYSVAIGDFNADGKPDLTVANLNSANLSVLLGNGDGTFQAAVNYGVGNGPSSVAVGDFNNDGTPDLAVTNSGGGTVSVLLGNGNGTFQAAVNYGAGAIPTAVAVADFNNDGNPDLAVENQNSDNVSILRGNGNGTFQSAVNYAVGSSPRSIAVSDFNNDGKTDVVTANFNDNNLSILLNGPPTASASGSATICAGDSTGLTGYGSGTTAPYSCSWSPSIGLSDANSCTPTASPSSTQTYTLTVVDGNGCSSANAPTVTVTVETVPNQPGAFTASSAAVCQGQSGVIYSVPNDPAATYNWSYSGTGATIVGTGNSVTVDFSTSATSGILSVTASNSCGTSTARSIAITVNSCVTVYLSSSSNPTTFGQPVTFSSSVSAVYGTPTGTVTFKDGATTLATVSLDGSARAQYTTTSLSAGSHAITAVYSGDSTHGVSTSGVVNQVVNAATAACGSLGTAVNYAAGNGAFSVAVGDFNGDSKRDVVVTNRSSNTLSVLLGNGDGTLQTQVTYAAGSAPYSVAVGDFNNDGKSDLAVANASGANVSVLLGNGDGTFQAKVDYGVSSGPSSVAVGDFNNDGKPDLAVTNSNNGTVSVLLGNGDGTFQAKVDYAAGAAPYSVAIGDFNHDGKPDLAVANLNGANLSVLLGNGNGTFQVAVNYGVGSNPASVAVGDFNNDGKPDLAVANSGSTSNNVSVLLGNANGTFQAAVNYGTGAIPASVAVADFNNDGKPDLAVANQTGNTVSILRGNGNGTFQTKLDYAVGSAPPSVAVGDFNADGKTDVVTANFNGNDVSILLNGPPTATVTGTRSICKGSSATIQAALTGTGPWSLIWSDGFSQTGVTSSPATRTVSPNSTTTYTVTSISDASCAGTPSGSAVITVQQVPTATVSGNATICPGSSTAIQAALTGTAPWNLVWSDGFTQTVSASPATRTVSPSVQTTYTVTSVSDAACAGNGTGSAVVKVNPAPSAVITAPAAVCANSTGNTASVPNAGSGATYSWSITNGTITLGAAARTITFTAGPTGPVGLSVTVTKAGCSSLGSASVPVNPVPSAAITAPSSVCRNSSGNVASVPDAGPGATYVWTASNGTITAGIGTRTITFSAGNKSVTLKVTVTNSNGCSVNSTKIVTITGC